MAIPTSCWPGWHSIWQWIGILQWGWMGEEHISLWPRAIITVRVLALQQRAICLLLNPRDLWCQRVSYRAILLIDWKSLQGRKDKSKLEEQAQFPPVQSLMLKTHRSPAELSSLGFPGSTTPSASRAATGCWLAPWAAPSAPETAAAPSQLLLLWSLASSVELPWAAWTLPSGPKRMRRAQRNLTQ